MRVLGERLEHRDARRSDPEAGCPQQLGRRLRMCHEPMPSPFLESVKKDLLPMAQLDVSVCEWCVSGPVETRRMSKLRAPDRSFYPAPLGSILSIWAHPDDETYLAGGVMAAARDRGQRVVCVSATAGENGTPDPEAWPQERLGAVRRWESAAAMAVLGVDEHRIADFPDGELVRHTERGVAWVADLIDEVEPDTILTFGSDGITFHPDHIALHEWVTRAWEDRGCRSRLLYAAPTVGSLEEFGPLYEKWGVYMTDDRPTGVSDGDAVVHVALTGPQLDRKMTALRALATQTGGAIEMLGEATYADLVAEEAFVDALAVDVLAVSGARPGTRRR